ncbi:FAD-binding oxidoreductase [Candidatus Saccharibacteria bacterium]|nr:FAD-binding oxidoreductase [Candidatus Saccharibacteria bacterium]
MSKVAHYLQEHLLGEVTASPEVRRHFAHDASILRLAPAIVAYPRNENDVRKTARFCWQLAERGRVLPITARGGGSDTSGAALGSGIMLVFTAHTNRILSFDTKKEMITVEPGVNFDKLEQVLYTHGLFLPSYPTSSHYATLGGSIANNAVGEKSVKYGPLGRHVRQLRVVLANGEVIETGRIGKKELNKKLGMSSFEGEIYRAIDGLLEDNEQIIGEGRNRLKAIHNAAGYNVFDVKNKDGIDLAPLFIGSQGTLGIITEATLDVIPHNPSTHLAMVSLQDLKDFHDVLPKILELEPSIFDMVSKSAIQQVSRLNPHLLAGLVDHPASAIHLFVEFDFQKDLSQKRAIKKLQKIVEKVDGYITHDSRVSEQEKIWKIRESVSTILMHSQGQSKAVPVAEDVSVPLTHLAEFLQKAAEIYGNAGLVAAAWGHAGDGIVRMQPMLDLGQTGDRQKLFRVAESIYSTVIEMGGSITASAGDGRVRAPYVERMYGRDLYHVMEQVKKIFDPYGILNPGVKSATREEVKGLMRGEYNLAHRHEHLPRS